MISAFGVEHGEVSKAFRGLKPKLGLALMKDSKLRAHDTMDQKMRRHAVEHRISAGDQGLYVLGKLPKKTRDALSSQSYKAKYVPRGTRRDVLRQQKVGAQGIYDTLGRQGRKNKVLP